VVHEANLGVYGARKIHAALNREGVEVARCTVERLMRAAGIQGIRRDKTRKITCGDGAETDRLADLVKRAFTATAPNQLWVADLTYIRAHAGWVYAAFVLEVFSRRVVGWQGVHVAAHRSRPRRARHGPLGAPQSGQDITGLTHHSDAGVQYRAIRYTERFAEADAVASVGTVGDSYDNAMAEALNSLFKAECIRNPMMRQGRVGVDPRRRDRGRRKRRLVQPPAPARRDRTHPAPRVRGRPLGIPRARQQRWRTGSRRSRFQITEPPRNPGRFMEASGQRVRDHLRRTVRKNHSLMKPSDLTHRISDRPYLGCDLSPF